MKWIVGIIAVIIASCASFLAGVSYEKKIYENGRSFFLDKPKNLETLEEAHPVGENVRFHQHIIIFPTGETKLIEYYTTKNEKNEDIGMTEPYRRELTDDEMENFRHLPMLNNE